MQTLSRAAQQRLDAQAEAAGIPGLILMERAGSAVADYIIDHYEEDFVVHVFCGIGKNAGDAYVVARILAAYLFEVHVWEMEPLAARKSELARSDSGVMRKALRGMGVEPKSVSAFLQKVKSKQIDFIAGQTEAIAVDGLLGTGYDTNRPLDEKWAELCVTINMLRSESYLRVISIDIPTGVDATTALVDPHALYADITITFENVKTGLVSYPGVVHSKKTIDVPLGLSPHFIESFWQNEPQTIECPDYFDIAQLLPARLAESHKGSFGKSLAICGSPGMAGAAVLAANAAMQSGLGLLTALVPAAIYDACLKAAPAVMWTIMAEDEAELGQQIDELMQDKSSILFGSGSAQLAESSLRLLLTKLQEAEAPLVLDAAALNYLAKERDFANSFFEKRVAATMLTPHPGEFARLAPDLAHDDISRISQAQTLAERYQATVVLKGMATVVSAPGQNTSINSSGNNGMAKAGTGDVLAGMILAFTALPRMDVFSAVKLAVYAHGLTADLIMKTTTVFAVSAESMVKQIPEALEMLSHPEEVLMALLEPDETE